MDRPSFAAPMLAHVQAATPRFFKNVRILCKGCSKTIRRRATRLSYAVQLEKSAARFLLRLRATKLKALLDEAIESLGDDPWHPGCRKLAGTTDR